MQDTGTISVPLPGWRDLVKAARANLEWFAAALSGATILNWRGPITEGFASKAWDLGAYLSAIFDWSSIQAAFIFGVYAFFLSRSEPFLQAISGTPAFASLRRYVVRTLYLSMTLTVGSLPFLVATPDVKSTFGFVAIWFLTVLLVFTFFSFLKVIRVFGKIDRRS